MCRGRDNFVVVATGSHRVSSPFVPRRAAGNVFRGAVRGAKDPQLPDDGGDRQGDPAPDGLLEGDGEVRARSARVRRRVREAGPGVSRRTKSAASTSSPE